MAAMAKPIMIQGTASGVGKTVLTIALCRIFKQDGFRVAPFKSQNMTTNTTFIKNGGEIAVSQVLQAYAAGTEPSTDMNPIVLKPFKDRQGTQIILNGYPYDLIDAYGFREIRNGFLHEIQKAYDSLASQYDIIVIEGAGSPVELNINSDDIVNMGIAKLADAPVLLAADIDRGGVFASLYGTISLLPEKQYVKATIINRFRGDLSYFADGITIIEKITGVPVAGIIPYFAFDLPEEDDLYTNEKSTFNFCEDYDSQFDLIADTVRKSLNMELIYQLLKMN
jgi:adenosylcobyric acid synthase